MFGGSLFVGVHMALTHGVTLGMVASYIPATEVEGIGRITGTCWSFTDFVFGAPPCSQALPAAQIQAAPSCSALNMPYSANYFSALNLGPRVRVAPRHLA
jgi:hypothetical protein